MRDLEGKLALVTGGGKGLGKVIAARLAERGAHVIVNFFHSLEQAKQTKAELEAAGARVDIMRASVARKDQVDKMFNEIESKYGHLDILVNNAASGAFLPIDEVTDEYFSRALDTNLKGSLWCALRAAPLMARRGGGTIINLSSSGAGQVIANYLVVGTSKAAVEALTRYLAVELGPLNIRVNTASGTLLEGEVSKLFPRYEEMKAATTAATPLGRIGTQEELADLVMFLISDQSRLITGQTILADGGLSLNSEGLAPPGERFKYTQRILQSLNLSELPVGIKTMSGELKPTQPVETAVLTQGQPSTLPTPQTASLDHATGGMESIPNFRSIPLQSTRLPQNSFQMEEEVDSEDIAIVGMGLTVPGANSPDEYWKVLVEGPDLFRTVPPDRWETTPFYSPDFNQEDKTYQSRSVFITDFVPTPELNRENGKSLSEYELTTLWLRHSLLQALQGVKRREGDRYSFMVGYTADGSQHLEEALVLSGSLTKLHTLIEQSAGSDQEKQTLFNKIRATLKQRYWRGTNQPGRFLPHRVGRNAMHSILPSDSEMLMVDTACSSSLYAVDLGIKGLLMGKQDIAVCGGSFALAPRGSVLFAKLHGLSVSGEVRPLDEKCDGVLFSDGAGVIILKKLKRALADGDKVLAIIKAFGSSSDGKGKAIYAPNTAGQNIAIKRGFAQPGAEINNIEWVIAHATGTPAGDLAEFSSIREMIKPDHPVYITSNKSLIGHTGWAAGVVSLINAVLGLQNQAIPPQHKFNKPPAAFKIEESSLSIPKSKVPWPVREETPRSVSVSGFGFGGTNAHVILEEFHPKAKHFPAPSRLYGDRVAVVAWAAHLPGLDNRVEVEDWIKGKGKRPVGTFGETYPLPPFEKVKMPPGVLRVLDRCQLMALECAHQLREQLGDFWEAHREMTGVLMGHMGTTTTATLYAARCHMDEIDLLLKGNPDLAQTEMLTALLTRLRQEVQQLVPPSTENSFPGSMPNVIPARISNYFDLKGLNMTLDTGFSSTLNALEMAGRYLKSGELEMALVGGINGNSTTEMGQIMADLTGSETDLAEGAFLFGLVLESTAQAANLPVLAYLKDYHTGNSQAVNGPALECGLANTGPGRSNYMGAEGALAVLKVLCTSQPETLITCRDDQESPVISLRLVAPGVKPGGDRSETANEAVIPARFFNENEYEPGKSLEVKRQVVYLADFPLEVVRSGLSFFPAGAVVLTNRPDLLDGLPGLPADLAVLSTGPLAAPAPNRFYLPEVTPEAVEKVFKELNRPIVHLRLLTDLEASAPVASCLYSLPAALVALQDLTFLTLKQAFDRLAQRDSSFISLFLNALPGGTPHPFTGLLGGTIKSTALELPKCLTFAVFTSSADVREGLRLAEAETAAKHYLPVIYYQAGQRKTTRLKETPGDLPNNSPARLNRDSVVVATAGARGITAELVKVLSQYFQPTIYLLGSNRLDRYPAEYFTGSDADFAKTRPAFLREQKAAQPGKSFGQLNKEFDRIMEARAARANMKEMQRFSGHARVHYIACDVLDRAGLSSALTDVVKAHGKIDLLINAAGLNRAASIPAKSFEDFCKVRDIKLKGYQNLKHALRDNPPRMWLNFGSFIGLTGQQGETDYASANDFLASSATYANEVLLQDEFTIGWTLWKEVGLGANPITKSYLEKSGLLTSMTTAEGIHHFVRELNLPFHEPSIVHVGQAEKQSITDYVPDFFKNLNGREGPARARGYYLGRVLAQTEDEITFERVFDLQKDAYIAHHVVNGYPTLPGTFVPEIAVEAASRLVPGLHVVALEDAIFHYFLRVYDLRRPSPKKINARIIDRSGDQVVVQIKVLTDVVAPNGTILTRDKLHFEIKAIMRKERPPAPYWEKWDTGGEVDVPDPYHFPQAPVLLTDMFVSTTQTRLTPLGKRAIYKLGVKADDPVFSTFMVPSIMLDGMARVAVLKFEEGEYLPLAAPYKIRRLDLYELGSDCEMAQRYDQIELFVTPRDVNLEDVDARNRFVAVRPDGQIIMQMKDVTGIIMGYVNTKTGQFVSKEQMGRIRQARTSLLVGASE